ncbi:hypothetical protein D3C86_1012410 [compost metagenome]
MIVRVDALMKARLPHKQKGAAAIEFALGLLTVAIHYPANKISAVIPFLNLPGIGRVPNLPATLTASASLQF